MYEINPLSHDKQFKKSLERHERARIVSIF